MSTDPARSANDGKWKTGTDAILKPLFPSRIPKKPKKSSGLTNPRGLLDLKRPSSSTLGVKEADSKCAVGCKSDITCTLNNAH